MNSKPLTLSSKISRGPLTRRPAPAVLCICCWVLLGASICPGVSAAEPNMPPTRVALSPDEPNRPMLPRPYVATDANDVSVVATTEEPNAVDDDTLSNEPASTEERIGERQRRQLWRVRISVPNEPGSDEGTDELKELIDTVRSIEVRMGQDQALEADAAPEIEQQQDACEADSSESAEPFGIATTSKVRLRGYEPVTDETLAKLEAALDRAETVANAFELADVLFLSGRSRQAADFYELAIDRIDPNSPTADSDRGWALVQLANCKRRYDRRAALDAYKQIIADYPKSPWASLAKAHVRLLDWLDMDNPGKLLQDCRIEIKQVQTITKSNYRIPSE